MITMYHDRGGELALTHYCMLHNQPSMILENADEKSMSFDFDERCGSVSSGSTSPGQRFSRPFPPTWASARD